jgi:hypothetical protein
MGIRYVIVVKPCLRGINGYFPSVLLSVTYWFSLIFLNPVDITLYRPILERAKILSNKSIIVLHVLSR